MKTTHRVLGVCLLGVLMLAACSNLQDRPAGPETEQESEPVVAQTSAVSTALSFLQPLTSASAGSADLDTSLTDALVVEICAVAGNDCELIATFDADGRRPERLRLEDDEFYMVNWNAGRADLSPDATVRILVRVTGMRVGSLDVTPAVRGDLSRTWPIRFHVENHPAIRVRVLSAQGLSPVEIAEVLVDEFDLAAADTAQLLKDDLDPFTAPEISLALKVVYQLSAGETARVLKDIGFEIDHVMAALKEVFELTDAEPIATALRFAGFTAGEITVVLDTRFDLIEAEIATALAHAGFTAEEIVTALDDVLELTANAILDALAHAGFTAGEITGGFIGSIAPVGEVNEIRHEFGTYQLYVPNSHASESKVVAVVHGTPLENQDVVALAERFINRWTDFAEATETVIVAPAFDQINFASHGGAFGGYRGLYGRVVGADEFLHGILEQLELITPVPTTDRRFVLYGHSAGGQFASRYLVRHPERVLAAALSAPGRYAFPDENHVWHLGMAPLNRTIKWELPDGTEEHQQVSITPDPDGWLTAATLPVTVVMGDQDLDQLDCIAAQCDPSWGDTATRIEIGQRWVDEMNALATENDLEGTVNFDLIPGVGHNSAGLTDASQEALTPYLTPSVPDVTTMPEQQALAALQHFSLRGEVSERRLSVAGHPMGRVIAQNPVADTVVKRGSTVLLTVSLGAREPADLRLMPDVIGMNEALASTALRAEGLAVSLTFADDPQPFGTVIGQRPEPGAPIGPEKEVHLIASRGPGDTP